VPVIVHNSVIFFYPPTPIFFNLCARCSQYPAIRSSPPTTLTCDRTLSYVFRCLSPLSFSPFVETFLSAQFYLLFLPCSPIHRDFPLISSSPAPLSCGPGLTCYFLFFRLNLSPFVGFHLFVSDCFSPASQFRGAGCHPFSAFYEVRELYCFFVAVLALSLRLLTPLSFRTLWDPVPFTVLDLSPGFSRVPPFDFPCGAHFLLTSSSFCSDQSSAHWSHWLQIFFFCPGLHKP